MPLHLLKLCVGVESIEELAQCQKANCEALTRCGPGTLAEAVQPFHITRRKPRRAEELLQGGSLYWVIAGFIQVRQMLSALTVFEEEDGLQKCRISFDPQLVPVRPTPKHPFQGWRYLKHDEAPDDTIYGEENGHGDRLTLLCQNLKDLGAW